MTVTEKTIILVEPIKDGNTTISELIMQRMTVGMMVDANAQCYSDYGFEPTQAMMEPYAFARACEVPVELIMNMGYGTDYAQLQSTSAFLTAGGKEETAEVEKAKGEAVSGEESKGEAEQDQPKKNQDSPEKTT